jgi:Icc-related predicted phosphoesterase
MGTRVVHFSDWHGSFEPLPSSDLYVCTGDMYPNSRACLWADKTPERMMQEQWAREIGAPRMAAILKPGSTVICVRGNHDYADLVHLFREHKGNVCEIVDPESFELCGIKWGGFRGVPPICGEWADEMGETELEHRCEALADVGVLVTHAAALGRRDAGYGSTAIDAWLRKSRPAWHLHGHIHEARGEAEIDGVRTSNAATTVRVLEIVQ